MSLLYVSFVRERVALLFVSIYVFSVISFYPPHLSRKYTERKFYLNLFRTKKILLVLQPKRIFLCNKEKFIRFKHLLLCFKDPLLKSKDPVI